MRHPFQCIVLAATQKAYILVAAAGSSISTYRLDDGAQLATWFLPWGARNEHREKLRKDTRPISQRSKDHTEPPDKRRKLSDREENSDRLAKGTAVDIPKRVTSPSSVSKPAVTQLAITSDAKYVIAVTGDDKRIRVFDLLEDGTLLQRSER